MEPRGTVRLWKDHSKMGVDLAESFRDHGWIVKSIFTGSRTPTASHEAGCFVHGYPAIKVFFSLSEPCPCVVNDLSDETKRSILAGVEEMAHMISVDPVIQDSKEYLPTKNPTAAEEPYDDDDDDDDDLDDDWDDDDDDDDLDDDDDDDDDDDWEGIGKNDKDNASRVILDIETQFKQLEFKFTFNPHITSYREPAFKEFALPKFILNPDDLKPICDLKKGDLVTIADCKKTSTENELVWKIMQDGVGRQDVPAQVTTECGATMAITLKPKDDWRKIGHIDEDGWFDSDISVLKKGDFIVLKNGLRGLGRKWTVMQDGEGQQAIPLSCECVHEDGCGATIGFTTLRMGDYWRKVGLIGKPGAAGIKEVRKPDDRQDDIFRQMFSQ